MPTPAESRRRAALIACAFALGCAQTVTADAARSAPPQRPAACPAAPGPGRWTRLSDDGAPVPRAFAAGVEVDGRLLVWGGLATDGRREDGGIFDPTTSQWTRVPPGAPGGDRRGLVVASLGARAMVWSMLERRGSIYDPATQAWTPISTLDAPRLAQRAVGTPGGWFVWALGGAGEHNEVALVDPAGARWRAVLAPLSQDARNQSAITWTGREVLVWGGSEANFATQPPRGDGVRYDPASEQWSSVETDGAPSPRWGAELFWTGDEALVWGGTNGARQLWDGGLYDPVEDRWRPIPSATGVLRVLDRAPSVEALSAWTGCALFVWAGARSTEGPRAVLFDPWAGTWREAAAFPGALADEGVLVRAVRGAVLVSSGRRRGAGGPYINPETWLWRP